jgi:hypothetical protein
MTRGIPRRKHFRELIRKAGGVGIAIENNCAIEFIDGRFYRVITSRSYAHAYRVHKNRGKVVAERISPEKQLAPIESLYRAPPPST